MTPPRVSVILPAFNRATTVAEAVRSVLDQDFSEIEVIVVDDASTDGTWDTVAAINDPRLSLIANTAGKGASSARNHGVAHARAPWIAFQDSDDLWLPGKLSAQMRRLEGSDFVASYCGMLVKADAHPGTPVTARIPDRSLSPLHGHILPSLVRGSCLSTQLLVLRRDVFDRVGGFDETLPALEDWELMLRIAAEGPVDFVDADLVIQRMSPNSMTRSHPNRLVAQEMILKRHAALIDRHPGARAHHHHRLASAHRRAGALPQAAAHAARAWRQSPANPRYLINALLLGLRARAKA
ncbi:glycosyltransferase family 2 protein [Falsirhodobacter sp. 20TX0035]|uniref:glycosyltransferase family 2 protein n=1 Tax=Falsirhodobacter sp. 20TX0035 TaxID=3022019 RepID=UPI0023314C10|nr:glycosyltransferase [Falsirhodobacter sp. 20TX0035]MDB6452838.1 glycosyltransferase [Falsirhodobacter sp. 20TX0035]